MTGLARIRRAGASLRTAPNTTRVCMQRFSHQLRLGDDQADPHSVSEGSTAFILPKKAKAVSGSFAETPPAWRSGSTPDMAVSPFRLAMACALRRHDGYGKTERESHDFHQHLFALFRQLRTSVKTDTGLASAA
jgi:hypothetical protein